MTALDHPTTIELSNDGFEQLKNSIHESKSLRDVNKEPDVRDNKIEEQETPKKNNTSSKKYSFKKGDQHFEIDDDFEFEMMADKKPVKMSFKELRERAAGDVAIKNRMHNLAEEKKRVQSTLKEFANISKTDPLGALEYISEKAKESDTEFEYSKYLEMLADQAEKLGKMDDKDRKSLELEKQLKKAKTELSQKERQEAIFQRKESMMSDYPQIDESSLAEMVQAVLESDEILDGAKDEWDVMDRVEDLIQETLTQRDIMTVIKEINPKYLSNENLIFSLSNQIKQNPDFDEEDIRDIIRNIIGDDHKQYDERSRDIQTLSRKQRQAVPVQHMREQNMTPYQLLERQLLERQEELSKTPLYKR